MPDAPLGIADVVKAVSDVGHPGWPALGDHWYWCRAHEQSVKVNDKCKASSTPSSYKKDAFWDAADHMVGTTWEMEYPIDSCIRIGPFMTEAEANRCMGLNVYWPNPLGMEVER